VNSGFKAGVCTVEASGGGEVVLGAALLDTALGTFRFEKKRFMGEGNPGPPEPCTSDPRSRRDDVLGPVCVA
jgi:hypothetical protein